MNFLDQRGWPATKQSVPGATPLYASFAHPVARRLPSVRAIPLRRRPQSSSNRSSGLAARLAVRRWGRVLLHLAVMARSRRNLRWHFNFIRRAWRKNP